MAWRLIMPGMEKYAAHGGELGRGMEMKYAGYGEVCREWWLNMPRMVKLAARGDQTCRTWTCAAHGEI